MEQTFYEIDPDGDTLLILHDANAPFAVAQSSTLPQEEQNGLDSTSDDNPAGEPQDVESKPEDADSNLKDPESKPTVQMKLSSKHLTFASKYFQKMTANGWKETTPDTTPDDNYSYVINAHDWDQEALLILMNIIHGRTVDLPRKVSLEMLAKIAVLVDYYQCHDTVAFFAKTWLDSLSIATIPPGSQRREYMLRIVVCLVFSESPGLYQLVKLTIQRSRGPIDSLGLPIRQDIIETMNRTREDAISGVISGLHTLKMLLCEDQSCTYECSSIYLGVLIKAMSKMQILKPLPSSPFPRLSLLLLETSIRDIKEPTWTTNCLGLASFQLSTKSDRGLGGFGNSERGLGGFGNSGRANQTFTFSPPTKPACTLAARTKPIVEELLRKINALELKGFAKPE